MSDLIDSILDEMTDEQFNDAMELMEKILRPPLGPHTHKCGFDFKDQRGCGFEWTHDGNDTQRAGREEFERTGDEDKANQVYNDLHACPQCGRGPWKLHVTPATRREMEGLKSA